MSTFAGKYLCQECSPENPDSYYIGFEFRGYCENLKCSQDVISKSDLVLVREYQLKESFGGEE